MEPCSLKLHIWDISNASGQVYRSLFNTTENFIALCTGHNLPDKSCVADTAMQIELA